MDITDKWYYLKPIVIHYKSVESYLEKLTNLEDVQKFIQNEKDKMNKYNKDILENNNRKKAEIKAEIKAVFKKLG